MLVAGWVLPPPFLTTRDFVETSEPKCVLETIYAIIWLIFHCQFSLCLAFWHHSLNSLPVFSPESKANFELRFQEMFSWLKSVVPLSTLFTIDEFIKGASSLKRLLMKTVSFIPFFVFGIWSLLAMKLWKYQNIT